MVIHWDKEHQRLSTMIYDGIRLTERERRIRNGFACWSNYLRLGITSSFVDWK